MWLVEISLMAAIVTALWYIREDSHQYKLGFLCLVLWGTTAMMFVDHVLGYLQEGGEFLEVSSDAMLLGVVLIIAALLLWELVLVLEDPRGKFIKNK